MGYTREEKYLYARRVQSAAAALAKAHRNLADLAEVANVRTFGDGGAQALLETDLNPNMPLAEGQTVPPDPSIGKDTGLTPAQMFAVINYGFTKLDGLWTGATITAYDLGDAINAIRDDV
jgi:glutamate mutase epsilon subunit